MKNRNLQHNRTGTGNCWLPKTGFKKNRGNPALVAGRDLSVCRLVDPISKNGHRWEQRERQASGKQFSPFALWPEIVAASADRDRLIHGACQKQQNSLP